MCVSLRIESPKGPEIERRGCAGHGEEERGGEGSERKLWEPHLTVLRGYSHLMLGSQSQERFKDPAVLGIKPGPPACRASVLAL